MSANDGRNETWAFAEIDRSLAGGVVQNGSPWHRDDDKAGAAVVFDGISSLHRRYLEGGGYGFMLGDGALKYGVETVLDFYYRAQITKNINLSVFYQPIINPAYNRDRGPVQVFSGRLHVAL